MAWFKHNDEIDGSREIATTPELPPPLPPRLKKGGTSQTSHFAEVEETTEISFLYHKLIEVGSLGIDHTITGHDITLRIPAEAIPNRQKYHFEIAVTMHGPFKFSDNFQPISPILWLCLEEQRTLKKPLQVILPHFLPHLTREQAKKHNVVFAKASHTQDSSAGDRAVYSFVPCDEQPRFASAGGKNFGILSTNHCCFYCLQAKQTHELTMESSYCLARIESFISQQRSEVHFAAVYCLPTCLRVRKCS